MAWRGTSHQEAGHIQVCDLMICDLCGALNLVSNRDCFVCGWHGRFEHRAEVVRLAMELLERRHGRLSPDLLSSPAAGRASWVYRVRMRLARVIGSVREWLSH